MHDELNEIALTERDLDLLNAEFNRAVTEAIALVTPATQPMGTLLPFPAAPRDAEPVYPRRRDIRNPVRPTWRGVAVAAFVPSFALADLVAWLIVR